MDYDLRVRADVFYPFALVQADQEDVDRLFLVPVGVSDGRGCALRHVRSGREAGELWDRRLEYASHFARNRRNDPPTYDEHSHHRDPSEGHQQPRQHHDQPHPPPVHLGVQPDGPGVCQHRSATRFAPHGHAVSGTLLAHRGAERRCDAPCGCSLTVLMWRCVSGFFTALVQERKLLGPPGSHSTPGCSIPVPGACGR
jgi:hypothetical protein